MTLFADFRCCFQICAAALRIYVLRDLTIEEMVGNMREKFPEALNCVKNDKAIWELGLTDREIVTQVSAELLRSTT